MHQKGSAHLILVGISFVIITIISVIYLFNQGVITNSLNSTKPNSSTPTQATQTTTAAQAESDYQNPFIESSTDYTNPFDFLE